jgi:exopolysaccharide biosynthesis polyprenyl glycosylphosphotransferase
MTLAFLVGTGVSYHLAGTKVSFVTFLDMRVKVQNFALFLGLVTIWHMIFCLLRLYESRRFSTRWAEALDVIKATSLGTVVIFTFSVLFHIALVTPGFLVAFWLGASIVTILSRLVLRVVLEKIRRLGRNLRNLLIVGTNPRAVDFSRKVQAKPELGYQLLGFVDEEHAVSSEFKQTGYSLVADFDGFPGFLRANVVDEVVVSLPVKSLYDQASRIVALCEEQGITVRFLSNIFNVKLGYRSANQFEDAPVITVNAGAMTGMGPYLKRVLDFSVSLSLLILLSPLGFIVGALIKLTSLGPVFFVQERIGLGKRRFRLYKFRTMVVDAEKQLAAIEHLNEISGPVFKIENDPRLTPIGKFLRKTSIDELPQLFNVLKGDMGLVGPRPLPVRDYEGFDEDWHRRRFSVRPGITCLWQVKGRSNTSFDDWMKLDMEYIDHWSLALDLKILLKTIPAVLIGSGAS